jgi:DMSO reductase anchor subunit
MTALGWVGGVLGLGSVFCMANIYRVPSQVAWNAPTTVYSFYATVILLGVMTIACLLLLDLRFAALQAPEALRVHDEAVQGTLPALALVAGLAVVADLALTFYEMHYLQQGSACTCRCSWGAW